MLSLSLHVKGLILTSALLGLASTSIASDTSLPHSFTASYEFDWNGGLSLSGSTIRQLKQQENAVWTFESKASAMFAGIKETSTFLWQNQQPVPIKYHYKQSALGKKRIADVSFDWEKLQVTNTVEDKPWQMPIKPGVQDKLSYQLLLQQEVAQGLTDFEYSVADGGKLKTYKFSVDGHEVIEAPIGKFDAIRVKRLRKEGSARQTYIWFAPALNFQIIKLHQIEKKDKSYTLLLKSLN